MKIIAVKYGESVFGENYIFKGGNKDKLLPISFTIYLIQTEEKNILVDVGCDDGAGFMMSVFKKAAEVLEEYGLAPTDITDVVITHSHHDHIEAIKYYCKAKGLRKYLGTIRRETLIPLLSVRKAEKTTVNRTKA